MAGMPPEQPPQDAAPAPESGDQGGGSSLSDLIGNGSQVLNILNEVIRDSGTDPEAADLSQQILQMYDQLVDKLSGGGNAPAGPENADAMAAGNPNARPMAPQG